MPSRLPKKTYWCAVVPFADWSPPAELSGGIVYIKGQQEVGANTGYHHWQLYVIFEKPIRKPTNYPTGFPPSTHWEATSTKSYEHYVWKNESAVPDTQFELGQKPFQRSSKTDWELVKSAARAGNLDSIPADIYVRYYGTLKQISKDHMVCPDMERTCSVFWGVTGSGKSHRARSEAGEDYYVKVFRTY